MGRSLLSSNFLTILATILRRSEKSLALIPGDDRAILGKKHRISCEECPAWCGRSLLIYSSDIITAHPDHYAGMLGFDREDDISFTLLLYLDVTASVKT